MYSIIITNASQYARTQIHTNKHAHPSHANTTKSNTKFAQLILYQTAPNHHQHRQLHQRSHPHPQDAHHPCHVPPPPSHPSIHPHLLPPHHTRLPFIPHRIISNPTPIRALRLVGLLGRLGPHPVRRGERGWTGLSMDEWAVGCDDGGWRGVWGEGAVGRMGKEGEERI